MERITRAIQSLDCEHFDSVLVASPEIQVVAVLMSRGNAGQAQYSYAFDGQGTLDHLRYGTFDVLVIDELLEKPSAQEVIVRTRMNLVHDEMKIVYVAASNPDIRPFEPFLLEHDRVVVDHSEGQ